MFILVIKEAKLRLSVCLFVCLFVYQCIWGSKAYYFPAEAKTKHTSVEWSREGLLFSSSASHSSNTGIPSLDFPRDQE